MLRLGGALALGVDEQGVAVGTVEHAADACKVAVAAVGLYLGEPLATAQCSQPQLGDLAGQAYGWQVDTLGKGAVAYAFYTLAQLDRHQVGTALEGTRANALHRGRNDYRPQVVGIAPVVTGLKGIVAYSRHTIHLALVDDVGGNGEVYQRRLGRRDLVVVASIVGSKNDRC